MAKKNLTKYWIRKFQEKKWIDFRELEVGSIFDTSVSNHVQMSGSVGNIIFWYRTDKDKGIYFITEVVAEPKKDDGYQNDWSMSLQVIKTLVKNPVVPELNGFENLMNKIKDMGQGGGVYNLTSDDNPEKLWELVTGNEKIIWKELGNVEIDNKDLLEIKKIKEQNINNGKLFNPFLDMNLVRYEVRHLSFLTNLLNPNGSHHQGTAFLRLFINVLVNNYTLENDIKKSLVNFCENENIYVRTEKLTSNGRIDIWIENDDYIIAIEGKTETVDSKNQLNKYDDFLQKLDKPYLLIYLTKGGENPVNNYPTNLQLMDFNDDIMTFISESINIETLPDKIYETLTEYYNSMITYLNDFNNTWTYDLEIIDEITKDKDNYQKYENIKNNYFYDTKKYKYTEANDVVKVFEKAKAKIERNFMAELLDCLDDDLENAGFAFSYDSNILVSYSGYDIDTNVDINTIYKARRNRTRTFDGVNVDALRDKTATKIVYEKSKADNEVLIMSILNDYYGINVYFNHFQNGECINYFENKHISVMAADEFYAKNISKFLNEDYLYKTVEDCKIKILAGLNGITTIL